MKKKITATILAFCMILGMAFPAFAVDSGGAEQTKDDLLLEQAREYGLLAYKDFADLDATATKLDEAKILVALGKITVSAPENGDYIFTDCDNLTEQEKNIVYATIAKS